MAGRAPTQASQALREKAAAELNHLNTRLNDQLRQDISRVYTDCLFADLHLRFHSGCVRTHKSLLETRAPRFYQELFNRCAKEAKSGSLLDRLTVRLIETFVGEIYTKNVLKHKEDAVVAQIKFRGVKDVDSPISESEVFLTPKASPCEPLPQEVPLLEESPNRSNYYSIVHLEEDLERELAEQDALSDSFRSILVREVSRKPTTLDFTKAPPEVKDVEREIEAKRAQALKVLNKQFTYSVDYEMSWVKESSLTFREEEASSGYITGGSPKTDPTREDSVTEVVSGEDIPHDGQSPISASSDQGTWDAYGQSDDVTLVQEPQLTPPKRDFDHRTPLVFKTETEPIKNNFFIDASSLIDEDEMFIPEINKYSASSSEQPKIIEIHNDNLPPTEIKSEVDISAEENSTNTKQERLLIRRNTFEFHPDDEKLALLKEEYEKANGYKVKTENADRHREDQPSSLPTIPYLPISAPEEDHSPDSLNCDVAFDSFAPHVSKQSKNGAHAENIILDTSEVKKLNVNVPDSLDINHLSLEVSAFSNMSNSSEPSSSLSASGVSSKREADTTEETLSSKDKSECVFNRFENVPICSGAAPLSDFSASDVSLTSSPMARRKTECAPILSGGYDGLVEEEEEPPQKTQVKAVSSLNTSWIVDMSDVSKGSLESLETREKLKGSNNSGLGFFVPLDDPYPSIDSVMSNSSERSDCTNKRSDRNSSCGFYIDLKTDSDSETSLKKRDKDTPQPEKKLFSMFIDIGNGNNKDSSTPKSKPGSPFLQQKRPKAPNFLHERLSGHKKSTSTSSDSGLDCGEHPEQTKGRMLFDSSIDHGPASISDGSTTDSAFSTKRQSFYMFIEADESPVPRRRTLPSGMRNPVNRHSWNSDKKFDGQNIKLHKRSSSISYDGSLKLELNDKYDNSGPQSIDETSQKKCNGKMETSWHGPVKPSSELSRIIQNGARHEFEQKARKSVENPSDGEAADKVEEMSCSLKSDDYESSNDNRTFVIDDVSKAVNISSNDLELSTPSHDIISDLSKDGPETDPAAEHKSSGSNKSMSVDNDITPKQDDVTQAAEEPVSFVKLSDMDAQPDAKIWESAQEMTRSNRMTRSIPSETSAWLDNTRVLANSSSSRSLSRLFPHLYPSKTSDASDTEPSNTSSMQSSIGPSPLEVSSEGGSEDSCGPGGAASSRLGQDLLRMFLDGISPDVTIDVGGRRIKAHKCILSSRCQYFAGMLSGGWVESAGNVISLQGFSYNAVHFALCHIYSGASNIPETINIVELATLADMLCLEGLKEVIMYTLKVKYCHFFHKPCSGCTVGVLECLPLAAAYGLDEIYRKSLRWTTRYFVRVWPTKGFASLPKELQDKCYKQHIVHMGSENVLDTIMGCEKLEATIPNVRWAQPVLSINTKLHEAAIKYLTQHFSNVLSSEAFITIGKEDVWTVTRLEETLLRVSKNLSPDQSCQAYKKIKALLAKIHRTETEDVEWKIEFLELLTQLETSIEDCLVRQAGRAARTSSWAQMDLSLRKKIQELACLVFTPGPRSASVSKSMEVRSPRWSDRSLSRPPGERTTNRPASAQPFSDHASSGPSSITQHTAASLSRSKVASPNVQRANLGTARTASAPVSAGPKRGAASKQTAPAQSFSASANRTAPPTASSLPRPRVNPKFSQVKPRYLEPKPARKDQDCVPTNGPATGPGRRLSGGGRPPSSSDSSRTSSPATNRVARSRPGSANTNKPKTPLGNRTLALARSGSGGNPSPSSTSSAGGSSKIARNSTFRVATKASQAKAQAPRPTSARHPHITQRSGTFLKESPAVTKRSQTSK